MNLVERLRDYYTPEGRALHPICDQAADELERLQSALAAVTAERDALGADAERYRWLRSNCECLGWGNRSDAAIDAAMASQPTAKEDMG